jgi:hypothetical protein
MGVRVKESGASECLFVMSRIGLVLPEIPNPKGCRLSLGLSWLESLRNLVRRESR